ncbi:MAG: cation-translocating P-type ATPase [Verrucomicrobia bacterium]|nr:cation-translocating P-type ATPase [Verrucomicrobiota bacterium]
MISKTPAPVADRGAQSPKNAAWHHCEAADVLRECESSETGLSTVEAARRLAANGPNELKEGKHVGAFQIFLRQFKSIIIWILIVAGAISGLMGEAMDAVAILAIVALNAVIGFYQEFSAEKSVATLRKLTAPQARVRRDGRNVEVAATRIVVGDILILEAGDVVAADGRLLDAHSLRCVESALTGEAEAVSKHPAVLPRIDTPLGDRTNMVFVGTNVAAGAGHAVVVATAMRTELGHIAGMITEAGAEEETPLQGKLDAFGRVLLWATLAIVALLFGLGLMRGTPPGELFLTSISLAVAAVPEGLPAVVTVALSLGVLRMARRHALLRKLAAVETLGSTSVICTDKTGTLTIGDMTARSLFVAGQHYDLTGDGYGTAGEVQLAGKPVDETRRRPLRELASILIGCNHARTVEKDGAWKIIGDPTEGALLVAGTKAGVDPKQLDRDWQRQADFPFDSDRKRSSIVRCSADGRSRVFVNGAPGPLLARCTQLYCETGIRSLTPQDRESLLSMTSTLATRALRVLGSAYRDLDAVAAAAPAAEAIEKDLIFVGLTGMYDPPRPEAKAAIAACHAAGIRVVMITGDHPETARAIAREIGLAEVADEAVSGVELDKLSDGELRRRAPKIAVYARVTAEHKLRIVRALKASGAVVAMTGDGINDAPAIKGADIGIAMGRTGAEVTKQAADMILTDDNFATILAAVEEGRGVYANIRKTLQYLLAGSTGELLFMAACVIIGLPTPLLPIHLLWINLVTDGLPALCLAADPIDTDVMKRPPRQRTEKITNPRFIRTMVVTGILTAGVTFAVYSHVLKTGTTAEARTAAFSVLVFAELLRAFGARSGTKPLWRITPLLNRNLLLVIALSFGLQLLSQHNAAFGRFLKTTPLSFTDCFALLALGAIPLVTLELFKVVRPLVHGARK